MGPGEGSGGHMMPGGSPGMGSGMGSQFMAQQSYGDAVSKGYGQPVMYGRPSAAYHPGSAYGGRSVWTFAFSVTGIYYNFNMQEICFSLRLEPLYRCVWNTSTLRALPVFGPSQFIQ